MDRIPTLQPVREARKPAPPRRPIRTFFKRMWARFPVRFAFVRGSCNWMWGDGATNPATGLPMYGGVDSAGNPYGTDMRISWNHHDEPAVQHSALPDLPPFHSDWDEPRVAMDSIDRRWGSDSSF